MPSTPTFAAAGQPTSMPDLIGTARKTVGWKERQNAAEIIDFFKKNGVDNVDPRVTAWCAAYVDAVLGASGAEKRNSLRAADFLTYGDEAKSPGAGNVVVFKPLAEGSSGHVGIVTGIEGDRVKYIAGNDGNAVAESSLPMSKVAGFRMPKGFGGTSDQSFGGLPTPVGAASTGTPMQLPDLTPVEAPAPAVAAEDTSMDLGNTFAKALQAFSGSMAKTQAAQKPGQVAQSPQMPPIRMDPAPRPRPVPIQATERGGAAPRKANLGAIFGG